VCSSKAKDAIVKCVESRDNCGAKPDEYLKEAHRFADGVCRAAIITVSIVEFLGYIHNMLKSSI
jgi:hypothetical protein